MLRSNRQIDKKVFTLIVAGLFVAIFLLATPIQIFAQTPEPTDPADPVEPVEEVVQVTESLIPDQPITQQEAVAYGNELSLGLYGYEEDSLFSPYDEASYDFGVPAEWELSGGAYVQLDLGVFFQRPDVVEDETGKLLLENIPGGLLRIIFNDVTLTTLVLEQTGEQTYAIPISTTALEPTRNDGRHELIVELIADAYCLYGFETTVVVRPTTRIVLPHTVGAPSTDLALLPRPFFQAGAFWVNDAILVVPNSPSVDELKAALAVSAGFGRLTDGDLTLTLKSIGELSSEELGANHLIFVGSVSSFPELSGLPSNVNEMLNTYTEDGLIYLGQSQWNGSKGMLLVSGSSSEGVVKAGQAVSSGLVIGSVEPNLALVDEINPAAPMMTVAPLRTFADLGYGTQTIRGIGTINREYQFYVPPGQTTSDNAYIHLSFAHSTLLDYNLSGVLVTLNGEPLGSARFTDETAQQNEFQAQIPSDLIRAGVNSFFVQAVLLPRHVCDTAIFNNFWLRVNGDSYLQLPLLPIQDGLVGRQLDLSLYPDVFALSPSEGSVAFVFPSSDTAAWNVASQVAYNIGDQTNWSLAELEVAFADNVSDEIRQSHDLLLFGRPSQLPLVAELGNELPAPFDAGSDSPREQNIQVSYRVPSNVSTGIIELIRSPWGTNRAVLAVLGNSDQGLIWSGAALTIPELSGNLAGDLAIVQDKHIITSDSRLVGTGSEIAIPQVDELESDTVAVSQTTPSPRPLWVLPVMAGAILLLMLVVVVAAFVSWRRKRRGGA